MIFLIVFMKVNKIAGILFFCITGGTRGIYSQFTMYHWW